MVIGLPPASVANILSCTYTTEETKALAKKKLGHWVGMMYSFAAVPALLGPIIAGHLITKYNTYITVQMWSGANLFLSFVCMVVARWYLPCFDGESFAHHLSRKQASTKEKLRLGSDATAVGLVSPTALSQAPTRSSQRHDFAREARTTISVARTHGLVCHFMLFSRCQASTRMS